MRAVHFAGDKGDKGNVGQNGRDGPRGILGERGDKGIHVFPLSNACYRGLIAPLIWKFSQFKLEYFFGHPVEKGRYYTTRNFHLQILNISRVIVSKMLKIGSVNNLRKIA